MDISQLRNRIDQHDWDLLDAPDAIAPGDLSPVLAVVEDLDAEAKQLVVELIRVKEPAAGAETLLKLAGDADAQVGADAAIALRDFPALPPLNLLLVALQKQDDELIRGELYLCAGRFDASARDPLSAIVEAETDREARDAALAALTRLGSTQARDEFRARIETAEPQDAHALSALILYTRMAAILKSLGHWLASSETVSRLGSDRDDRMARMCDIAVWTLCQAGADLAPSPAFLDNYDADVLQRAAAYLNQLPGA